MDKIFISDKPISNKEGDKFQRYGFAKRIANTISAREDEECIVLGIYGTWGEGKTSVINFIENELDSDSSIIKIRFNPWRFAEETILLTSFFNTIAYKLNTSCSSDISNPKKKYLIFNQLITKIIEKWKAYKKPLHNNKETIGEIIEKYGKIVSGSKAGDAVESIGKALSKVDVETIKKRFEELLLQSEKKLVIFIDDIDRLDKQEIHSIFRLVKLTANFSNTIYILAFDQEMVAASIGERFGGGDKLAGLNFLEKIIQVPLKIPFAQPDALYKYCSELIDKAISENNIRLSEKEVLRFSSEFREKVLIRLKTPRLAIRYGNTLSFSLQFVKGEVNTVDLMLIEAIKIFYPTYYTFIKENSHYFLSSYREDSHNWRPDVNTNKRKEISDILEELGSGYSKNEKESIKSLLIELFPRLDEALNNTYMQMGEKEWYNDKRIASPDYFKRYFSYTVLIGDLSDVTFENFITKVPSINVEEINNNVKLLIDSSSIDIFLFKLYSKISYYDWETSKKLALSIASLGNIFIEDNKTFTILSQDYKSQAGIFIYNVLKKHENTNESFEFAVLLMDKAYPFSFADEINFWLRTGKTENDKLFSIEQYQALAKALIKRALFEAGSIPLFEKFPNNNQYILSAWKEINHSELYAYITQILDASPKKVMNLIRAFTPINRSSSHPSPFLGNFSKDQYVFFTNIFDKDYIYNKVNSAYKGDIEKENVVFTDFEDKQTDINILRQFNYWYLQDNGHTLNSN